MSEGHSKLSEVQKLLKKVNYIYTKLGGKDENTYDSSKEKDEFQRIRYDIRHRMNQVEAFLQQRSLLENEKDAKKILEKQGLNNKIDSELQIIKKMLDELSTVYESQKKNKKKYTDTEGKGQILTGLRQGYDLLKCQNEGTEPIAEKSNKNALTQLEELIGKNTNTNQGSSAAPQREIYEEEQAKIDEWGNKIKEQDNILVDIRKDINQLGREAKVIGEKEEELGAKIAQTAKMANKTEKKLTETRNKLHDLLEKYKSADRFCIDIVLICICLGLIAVLYNLVKSKFFNNTSTTTTNTTNKMFLYY